MATAMSCSGEHAAAAPHAPPPTHQVSLHHQHFIQKIKHRCSTKALVLVKARISDNSGRWQWWQRAQHDKWSQSILGQAAVGHSASPSLWHHITLQCQVSPPRRQEHACQQFKSSCQVSSPHRQAVGSFSQAALLSLTPADMPVHCTVGYCTKAHCRAALHCSA